MSNAGIRRRSTESERAIKSICGIGVATQRDLGVVVARELKHVLRQLPANPFPSFVAPHIKPA